MKNILALLVVLGLVIPCYAQITITSSDMPVSGDTLRYSFASPVGATISPADSGASMTWNYPLTSIGQAVDTYQSALSVNPLYVVTIGFTAFGYKVADSLPLPLPGISIQQIYTFFETKSGPSRYQAEAFAANISGVPTAIKYTTPDVWYFFPLTYYSYDSSNYALNIALPSLGGIKEAGYRKTRVDGWGTITTPYYTTGVNCIRVRSEIHEIDSVKFGSFPAIGLPRDMVEYKWLANGQHYPALWVTSNLTPGGEIISGIRYRDNPAPDTTTAVPVISTKPVALTVTPDPVTSGIATLQLPATWTSFNAALYDVNGRLAANYSNNRELNISGLPDGQYLCKVVSPAGQGYVVITKCR